jgi:tetratricopeptide (TPR) repeat protein
MGDLTLSKPTLREKTARLFQRLHLFKLEPTGDENVSRLFASVLEKARKSDFDCAIERLNNILGIDPNDIQAHCFKGLLYLEMRIFTMAEMEFDKTILASGQLKQNMHVYYPFLDRYISIRYNLPICNFNGTAYYEVKQAMVYLSIGYPQKAKDSFDFAISFAKKAEIPAVPTGSPTDISEQQAI